jgi:hypothetical protein
VKRFVLAAFASLGLAVSGASAATFTLDFGANSQTTNAQLTGAAGTVTFDFSDDVSGDVLVTLTVTNTTGDNIFGAGATESQLTGFGFDFVDGVSFNQLVTQGSFLDTVILNASSGNITLDFALADNNNFTGGNAQGALPEGQSDTIAFLLDTTMTADMLMNAFMTAFFGGDLDNVLRFQSVNAGAGSDKLTFVANEVPLPAALPLFAAGLAGIGFMRRRKTAA